MAEPVNDGEKPAEVGDDDVDAVLREFDDDPRAAIRALLHNIGSWRGTTIRASRADTCDADRVVTGGRNGGVDHAWNGETSQAQS